MIFKGEDFSQGYNLARRSAWFFGLMVACPFVLGLISSWTAGLGFFLFLFCAPVLIVVFLAQGSLCVVRGIKAARQYAGTPASLLNALAAPTMMALTAMLAWPSLTAGGFSGTWTRLMVNRSHYEAIIAKARQGHCSPSATSSAEEDGGVEYIVDAGPPIRVAFNPEGMLDNWSGIVFDPTGEVMSARGFNPITGKFVAPQRVTKLFGGDLVRCRHLWSRYYDCSFT